MAEKKIKIKCRAADLLPFKELQIFQGQLKQLSKQNLEKLKTMIIEKGFCAPLFVWKEDNNNWVLDGTQRDKALKSLQDDGYEIPLLPVAYIDADNEQDAREKLLAISSQYGTWDIPELEEWTKNIDSEIKEKFRFIDKEVNLYEEKNINIKNETIIPYQQIHILLSTDIKNIDKFNKLIEEIKTKKWLEYEQSQN